MRLAMSERDRRTLVVGAAVVALLVGGARGVPAWRSWEAAARASAAEMQTELARAEAAAAALPAALDSLEARRDRFVALAPGILGGETPSAAAAALAARLSGAAALAGVTLGAVQVRPDTAATGTFTRITARVTATGDLPGLMRLLAELEGGPELLSLPEVSIQQPAAGGPAERMEALRMELVVHGLSLPRGDSEAASELDVSAPELPPAFGHRQPAPVRGIVDPIDDYDDDDFDPYVDEYDPDDLEEP